MYKRQTAKIADDAVTLAKLDIDNTGTTGQALTRSATGLTWATISTSGSGTVSDGSITTVKLANLSVTTAKIANQAVDTTQLANDAVTLSKIDTASTGTDGDVLSRTDTGLEWISAPSATIADDSITEAKLDIHNTANVNNVLGYTSNGMQWITPTRASVNAGGIGTSLLADGAVTTAKVAIGAITTEKLANNINGNKIANGSIGVRKLSGLSADPHGTNPPVTGQVITYNNQTFAFTNGIDTIKSGGITTAKIADDAVTVGKLATTSDGTANQVLTRSSTGMEWSTPTSGGGGGSTSVTTISWTPSGTLVGDASTDFTIEGTAYRIGNLVFFRIKASFASGGIASGSQTAGITFNAPYGTPSQQDLLFPTAYLANNTTRAQYAMTATINSSNDISFLINASTHFYNRIAYFSGAYIAS